MPSFPDILHLQQQRVLVAISRVQGSDSQIQKFHSSHRSCRVHSTPLCLLADLKWSLRPSLEANRSLKEARERERKRKEWRLQPQKESALLVTAKVREGSLEVRCNPVCKDTLGSNCLYFDSRNLSCKTFECDEKYCESRATLSRQSHRRFIGSRACGSSSR